VVGEFGSGSIQNRRLTDSYCSVNRYGEPGLQWAGMEVWASVPLRQDWSMFSPAGRIGNGKRPWSREISLYPSGPEIVALCRLSITYNLKGYRLL
jgi:hypothetical protein